MGSEMCIRDRYSYTRYDTSAVVALYVFVKVTEHVSDCEPSLSTAIVTVRYCWKFHPEISYIALALGRGLRETRLVFAGSRCNKQTRGIILKAYTEETS